MSFREPLLLAGLVFVPLALLAYWAAQRRRRRYAIRYPAVDVLAGVAGQGARPAPAGAARAAVAPRTGARARPSRAHDRRRAAPGHRDAGARHVGLDAGDRRRARPAERGARGGAHARALAAGGVPARGDLVQHPRRADLRADDRPRAGAARARFPEGPGRHRDGRRPAARDQRHPHAGDRDRRAAAAAARRDRAAFRRREHEGHGPARGRRRGEEAEDPDLRGRARHAERHAAPAGREHQPGAARHRDARVDRATRPAGASSRRLPGATSRPSTRTSGAGSRRARPSRRSRPRSPAAGSRCCSPGS